MGTGLSGRALAGVLTLSVGVFLLWDGALWSVPAGASHVERMAVSYAVVIPAVELALRHARRWSAPRLLSATALIWAAKLLVTSTLYAMLVAGGGDRYAPVRTWEPNEHRVNHGGRR